MKRQINDVKKIRFYKNVNKAVGSMNGKMLPHGFDFIKVDGKLAIKNIETGEITTIG